MCRTARPLLFSGATGRPALVLPRGSNHPLAKTSVLVHSSLIISLYCPVMICVYPLALAFLNNHSNSTWMHCSFVSQYHRKYNARPSVSSVYLVDLIYQQIMHLSLFLTYVAYVCWRASARMYATIRADVSDHPRVCSPTDSLKCSYKPQITHNSQIKLILHPNDVYHPSSINPQP